MRLITFSQVQFSWRSDPLLNAVDWAIDSGEKVGLLGRNGMGKSTFLKLIAGEIQPESGQIRMAPGMKIARLIQEVPQGVVGTIDAYLRRSWQSRPKGMEEEGHAWREDAAVQRVVQQMKLDPGQEVASLSAGWQRRVLLAEALMGKPDLLLLDEPTNHLDLDSIEWLEQFLKGYEGSLVFVTHDRAFLRAIATRITEIDRGRLYDWACDYTTFLQRKENLLAAQEKQDALFDKKLAAEEVWIRTGIKARRTRNEGRVRALESMRRERSQRLSQVGGMRAEVSTLRQSGQLVMELEDVSFGYPGKPILKDFSTWIMRGDKIGIVGGNGAGKSTFIKLLMGNLQPHSGTIRRGTHLQTLYFDQLREQIDDEKTIADNVADGNDQVIVSGKPKHIYSYLQDFLFTPERARQLAKTLSGGERHRLLLARLLKNPSNLLVLDEPTNDLDEETLELLEALLVDYPGTLLVVSHDREFLQRTTTSVLAFDRQGVLREFAGGYDDYARYRQREREIAQSQAESNQTASSKSVSKSMASLDGPSSGKQAKLSFKEQRDLESLPGKIEAWEAELNSLQAAMGDAAFYQKPAAQIAESAARVQELQQEIEQAYERWQALEERRSG